MSSAVSMSTVQILFRTRKDFIKSTKKEQFTITAEILACSLANFHVSEVSFSCICHSNIDQEFHHNIVKVVCEPTCLDRLLDLPLLSHYYDS